MPATNSAERPPPPDRGPVRGAVASGLNGVFLSLERLAGGLITALAALWTLAALAAVAVASAVGVGLLLVPGALRLLRAVAERERRRLAVVSPYGAAVPPEPFAALRSLAGEVQTRRDLGWLACHASLGLLAGVLGVLLPVAAVRDITFPLWWSLLPPDAAGASIGVPADDWYSALAVGLLGVGWGAVLFGFGPALARLQSWPGRALLGPRSQAVLAERVARLTATRAAALQAHTAELRRIERSLHDGAQSRLVAVTLLLGTAQRALATDPQRSAEVLERAQTAAEEALAELRGLVRGILPPILEDRGLDGALSALVAGCAVPCTVEAEDLGQCASSIEATVYFTVAEALSNASRHGAAGHIRIRITWEGDILRVNVRDDGRGGADENAGTGLAGIRKRAEAHDGAMVLTSPAGGPTDITVRLPCGS